jgi:LysR family transcriptional regulator, benzoate and cis,cis-muconate-responsive activator of ben and cat genes
MELRHLRYFVAVARERNFTQAARKLRVAQPALSRQIRQLEEELGVKLLERGQRGAGLTEAGNAFLAEADALLRQSEQAIQVARQTTSQGSGQLKLGYVWGLFHSLVPVALTQFRQVRPEVGVHLFDLSATQQAEALAEGRLDAGFIGFAFEADAADLRKRKVASCKFVAALPQKHRIARSAKISLEQLREDFFLGISEDTYPGASRYVMDACARAGFRPKILEMVERGYTILGLVASRCGVALLPESLQALPHPGVVFRPVVNAPEADLFVAWKSFPVSQFLAEFLNLAGTDHRRRRSGKPSQ